MNISRISQIAISAIVVAMPVFAYVPIAYATPSNDNNNIRIVEDDERFDCRTMGDNICGINNTQNVVAGLYNANGELIDASITCAIPMIRNAAMKCVMP